MILDIFLLGFFPFFHCLSGTNLDCEVVLSFNLGTNKTCNKYINFLYNRKNTTTFLSSSAQKISFFKKKLKHAVEPLLRSHPGERTDPMERPM